MKKLEAICCKCKVSYPQEEFARKDIEKKRGKLVAKSGKSLVCHTCGNGSVTSNERRAARVEDILKIEKSEWESEDIIESFDEHCKRLAEGNYQPWAYSTSLGRTFKDRGKVSWHEIKEVVSIYRLELSEKHGPGFFIKSNRSFYY